MALLCLESQGCHLIPLSCPISYFSAHTCCYFCPRLFPLSAHSPDFFPQKILQYFSLRDRPLLSSWEVIVGRWFVQLAALWHGYLLFCIYIMKWLATRLIFVDLTLEGALNLKRVLKSALACDQI